MTSLLRALPSPAAHAGRRVSTIVSKPSHRSIGADDSPRLTFAPRSYYWLVVKRG